MRCSENKNAQHIGPGEIEVSLCSVLLTPASLCHPALLTALSSPTQPHYPILYTMSTSQISSCFMRGLPMPTFLSKVTLLRLPESVNKQTNKQTNKQNVDIPSGLRSKNHLPKTLRTKCACTTCMMTRQSEKPRKSKQLHSSPRASRPLQRVNVDLYTGRPYPDASFGSFKYVFVAVDSFTGRCFTYLIVHRSDALHAFRMYYTR